MGRVQKYEVLQYSSQLKGVIQYQKEDSQKYINHLQLSVNSKHFLDCQQAFLPSFTQFMNDYSKIKKLTSLSLQLILMEDTPYLRESFMDFILNKVIAEHQQSIQCLEIADIQLFKGTSLSQQEENEYEQFLLQLLLPLKNLKQIIFQEEVKQHKLDKHFILKRVLKLILNHGSHFNLLQHLMIDYNKAIKPVESEKKAIKEFKDYFLNASIMISKIKSINRINVCLEGFHLDSSFCQKFLSHLINPNITKVGICFLKSSLSTCDFLSNLKLISEITNYNQFKGLSFIDDSTIKLNESQNYLSIMQRFENLHQLQIERLVVQKEGVKTFFDAFKSLQKLTKLILDLRKFEMNKDDNYEYSFKMLSTLACLESINIVLPQQQKIKKSQTLSIAQFILSCKNTLKKIHFTLNNIIEDDTVLIDSIIQAKNLKKMRIACSSDMEDEELNQLIVEINTKNKNNQEGSAKTIFEKEKHKIQLNTVFIDETNKLAIKTLEFMVLLQFAVICSSKQLKRLKLTSYTYMDFIDLFTEQNRMNHLNTFIQQLTTFRGIEQLDIYDFENLDCCVQKLIENNISTLKKLSATPDIFNQHNLNERIINLNTLINSNSNSLNELEQIQQQIKNKNTTPRHNYQEIEIICTNGWQKNQSNEETNDIIDMKISNQQSPSTFNHNQYNNEEENMSLDEEEQSDQNQSQSEFDLDLLEILEIERKKKQQSEFYELIYRCKKLVEFEMNYYVLQSGFPYTRILQELPELQSLKIPLYNMQFSNEDIQCTLDAKYLSKLSDVEEGIEYSFIPYLYLLHKKSVIQFIYAFQNILQPDFYFNSLHAIWDLYL